MVISQLDQTRMSFLHLLLSKLSAWKSTHHAPFRG